jgi:hypothetical protein
MDNVQNCDTYINVPSSQTYSCYMYTYIYTSVVILALQICYSDKMYTGISRHG